MSRRPPRVLFVSHQSSLTGTPMVLLHLLRWLKEHSDIEAEILLMRGGPLDEPFSQIAPIHVLQKSAEGSFVDRFERGLDYLGVGELGSHLKGIRLRYRLWRLGRFDLVYLNAARSFSMVRYFPPRADHAVIAHLHELDIGIRASLPRRPLSSLLPRFTEMIVCSEAVATHLIKDLDVPADLLRLHYEFVAAPSVPDADDVARVRAELRIPDGAVVVGNVGTAEWRKGPDVFVLVAARIHRRNPGRPIVFVWVGANGNERDFRYIEHALHHTGIAHLVHFVPPVTDVRPYYALFDVMTLTSREDPFPLVCLEAAAQQVPTVAFEGAGGIPEFLLPDCGVVVPFLDIEEMALAVEDLLDDPARRQQLGVRARAKVEAHHTVDVVAPRIQDEIESVLAGRRQQAES